MRIVSFILLGFFLFPQTAKSQGYCDLIGTFIYAQDKGKGELGTYLGLVSNNPYLSESITNQFGTYGSKFSSTSILNEFGRFGGEFSSYSPFNDFTSTPPIIWEYNRTSGVYSAIAYLSTNKTLSGTTADPNQLMTTLNSGNCPGGYVPPVSTRPDLIIDSMQAYISDKEDSIIVDFIVANMGGVSSPAFSVSIEINGIQIPAQIFSPLNSKMYFSSTFSQKIKNDTTTVIIWADYEKMVTEDSDENNFAFQRYITPVPNPVSARRAFLGRTKTLQVKQPIDILGRRLHNDPLQFRVK